MPWWPCLCVFPTNKNIFLHNHNTTIKIRKLILMHLYHVILRSYSHSAHCPSNVLYSKRIQSRITHCISFNCHNSLVVFNLMYFLCLSLTLIIFKLFEDYRQLFHGTYVNCSLSDVSSWLDWIYCCVLCSASCWGLQFNHYLR
jgi:hypothetical protein